VAVDAAGAVYGATSAGGAGCKPEKGCGTVFKLAPPAEGHGWALSTIAVFPVGYDNGYFPYGGVIFDKQGNLYGISWIFDGTYTVNSLMYKLIPNADGTWTAREMAGFRNGDCQASANLALDQNGMLYGAVPSCQYVFQISPDAQLGNLLGAPRIYSFANGTGTPNSPVTIDASGVVYGATTSGAVYSLTEPASPNSRWTYKLLYQFTEATLGLYPNGGLVFDSAGALYGTTNDGGSGHGVLFRLSR
jgi:hypothetical protein